MALKFELTKAEFESLDAALQSLYSVHKEGYRLEVSGIDPADELKEALRKEREERADAKRKLKEFEEGKAEADRLAAEQRGEYQKLYAEEKEATAKLIGDNETLRRTIADKERTISAGTIAASLTRDTAKAALLQKEALSFIQYTPDGVKINGKDGAALTPEQLGASLASQFPFLVDGSQASGGGASGSQGSGAAGKTLARQDFNRLPPNEQATFARQPGATITD